MLYPTLLSSTRIHYPPEPHMDAAAHEDCLQAKADEHEAQQKRAHQALSQAFSKATPETWAKKQSIGGCRDSLDELLSDALYQHKDKGVLDAFKALMCSEAAAELREAVASYYADKYPEDFDHNSDDGEKEFPHA